MKMMDRRMGRSEMDFWGKKKTQGQVKSLLIREDGGLNMMFSEDLYSFVNNSSCEAVPLKSGMKKCFKNPSKHGKFQNLN